MAMATNPDTSSHMTYSANHGGIGMAANHIVGGMSAWINSVALILNLIRSLVIFQEIVTNM